MSKARTSCFCALVFLLGGLAYCGLELMFRGRTHPSMFVVGGLCVMFLYIISVKSRAPAWKKWIVGGAVITTVEFIAGAVVNILLGWAVWDYSHMRFNLMGQISLQFSLLWVLLSIPVVWVFGRFDRKGDAIV